MKNWYLKKSKTLVATVLAGCASLLGSSQAAAEIVLEDFCCHCPSICDENSLCGGQITVSAEALIWRAVEDGLNFVDAENYVRDQQTAGANGTALGVVADDPRLHDKWDTGYRLGAAFTLPCHKWTLGVNWTHFNNTASKSAHSDFTVPAAAPFTIDGTVLIPTYGAFIAGVDTNRSESAGANLFLVPDFAKAHWKLHLNLVDIEMARECRPCACFVFTPHVGVRVASIKQNYKVQYAASRAANAVAAGNFQNNFFDDIRMHSKYDGAGLKAGFNAEYDLGCGFALYGGAAASVLYGKFDVRQNEDLTVFADANGAVLATNFFEQKHNFRAFRGITDLAIGLQWRHCCQNCYAVTVKVGYEHHLFLEQNHFDRFPQVVDTVDHFKEESLVHTKAKKGDLGIQGVTIGARLDF